MRVVGGFEITNIAQIVKLVAVRVGKLRGIILVIDILHIEDEHFQVPFLCDSRVRLAQCTSGAVAGIGKQLLPCCFLLGVGRLKVFFAHIALAAQFDFPDIVRHLDIDRDAKNLDIVGNIFTDMTVAASGRLYEPQLFVRTGRLSVHQRQAQAVNFALNGEGGIRILLSHGNRKIAHLGV